jgi:hypothetical protein
MRTSSCQTSMPDAYVLTCACVQLSYVPFKERYSKRAQKLSEGCGPLSSVRVLCDALWNFTVLSLLGQVAHVRMDGPPQASIIELFAQYMLCMAEERLTTSFHAARSKFPGGRGYTWCCIERESESERGMRVHFQGG